MIENNKHWKWKVSHPKKIIIPKEIIEQLYSKGKTMQEIAILLNTTKRVIQLRMQEYNIDRRKMIGKNHGSWKGGRVNKMGYVGIWMPTHLRANNVGYVKEHILVMENELNRPIEIHEHIHHIDFDKKNNDPNNLWLTSNSKHHIAQNSIFKIIKPLLDKKIIEFDRNNGKYIIK